MKWLAHIQHVSKFVLQSTLILTDLRSAVRGSFHVLWRANFEIRWVYFFCPLFLSALSYQVKFVGIDDAECLRAVKDASALVSLQDRPPPSINGLRYRAESDIAAIEKTLRAFAYYDTEISYEIQARSNPVQVIVTIRNFGAYKLASYEVFHETACKELLDLPNCCPFTPKRLGLKIGGPARSVYIVNAELQALTELSRCGYPLGVIDKRRVEVDSDKQEVHAAVCIQEGPFSKFGPSILFGLKEVHPRFIERRIEWTEGKMYDSDLLVQTEKRIMKTDLFSSVYISHGEALDEMGELPMQIRFTESKHKQLSLGGYYATADGFGVSFAWINRNLRGMGETLAMQGDFSMRSRGGSMTYKKPDFLGPDQLYRAAASLSRQRIFPFTALVYGIGNFFDKDIDDRRFFTVGFEAEHYKVTHSATNGSYALASLPLMMRYDTSNDPLNPTTGYTLVYQAIPYQSFWHGTERFIKQRFTTTFYIPINHERWAVLALRAQFGSIAGTRRKNVPLPLLFLGGSDDDLRGYRYLSVSPLNHDNKPLGGKSAIFTSAEIRLRFGQFGVVPFADFGTVTSGEMPELNAKWFKSVGIGLRYFAFFGPLRLDVGFPLDKREFDPVCRVYASVGQSF
jgi:translocation and assembly module TamA